MLNRFAFFFFIILVVFSCSTNQKKDVQKEISNFNVTFFQNDEEVESSQGEVFLKKVPFTIRLELPENCGIFVNASKDSKTYFEALEGLNLDKLNGFKGEGFSEEFFNSKELLFLSNNSPNYWYYNSDEDNRFNSVKKENEKFICIRKVSNLSYSDLEEKEVKIRNYTENKLFLVFIQFEWNSDYTKRIEKKRLSYEIVFSRISAFYFDEKQKTSYN